MPLLCVEFPTGYPRILLHPKLKSVEKGLSTVMQCEASGDPEPTIMWLKDMMPVDLSDPRIQLMENGEGDHEQLRSVGWFNVGLCPDGKR